MESEILFSIIVPVFNSESYLEECLQSVLKQNFKSLEIILIDDGSKDRSGEICDSYSRRYEFIKTIRVENSGASAARNRGIREACGQYILFLDSDDRSGDGSLEGVSKLLHGKTDVDVVIGRYIAQRYGQRGEETLSQDFTFNRNTDPSNGILSHIPDFSGLPPYCWRYVINRNFLLKNDLFFIQTKIYEDMAFTCKLLCLADTFLFYPQGLYWHRARSGGLAHSSVHSAHYDDSLSYLEVANNLCKFAHDHELSALKKTFVLSRTRSSLKAFYGCLPMHTDEEILNFSKRIEPSIDHYKILKDHSQDVEIYSLIKKFGAYAGLLGLIKNMTDDLISLVKKSKKTELYVFCADLFGRATAQLLKKEGYPVKGFLDNNQAFNGGTFLGLNVYTPSFLSYKTLSELADVFIIVCHQQKNIFEKISNQLQEIGLKRDQITQKIF